MSLIVDPDEGPFVFGAYATHLDQTVPVARPVDADQPLVDPVEQSDDGQLGSIAC